MYRIVRALILGFAISLLGLAVATSRPGAALEETIGLTWLFMARGPADRPEEAVIVSLDRYSAQRLQLTADPRYWPRAGRALMIDRVTEAGATTIVLDTYLERETDPANDEALAQAIARSGKVVLLTRLVPADMLPASGNSGIAANAMPAVGLADPVPMFSHVRALAPFPLPTGEDRLCRTWAFIADLGDRPTLPAVALQIHLLPVMEKWRSLLAEAGVRPSALSAADRHALDHPGEVVRTMLMLRRAFLKEAGLAVRLREILKARHDDWSLPEKEALGALIRLYAGPDSRYLNLYGYQGRIRTISYADIVDPAVDISGLGLSGKVIFVGNSDPSPVYNSDSHRTVFSTAEGLDISGVEIGATAFLNLLKGSDLRQPDVASRTAILLLSGFVFGLAAYLLPVPAALALAAAAACLYFGGTFLAFTRLNLWPPVAVPLLVQLPAALLAGLLWQQRNISRSLRSYLSPRVAEALRTVPADIRMVDRPVYGVCLATDVQGYTTLSEALSPSDLASLTNSYFDAVFEPVLRRNGMVTGIAGDGVMSVWASPAPDVLIRGQAALAAIDVMHRVDAFNESIAPRAMPTRFGLSAGLMVLGNIGGAGHFAFSAIGDIPNTASRLEGLNKHLGTRILATEEVVDGMRHLLIRPIGRFRLMGKADPVSIHEILCPLATSGTTDRMRCEAYEEALSFFEKGCWSEAERRFSALASEFSGDGPALYMLRLCREQLTCAAGEGETVIQLASN